MRQLDQHNHLKGYRYFIQALNILKYDRTLSMMDVYEIIADIHNVTPDSVRKALERYIKKISKESPARHLKQF